LQATDLLESFLAPERLVMLDLLLDQLGYPAIEGSREGKS
jgi:hypothetical protein